MSSDTAFLTILGITSGVIGLVSLFLAFFYALLQLSRHRAPAQWLLMALATWGISSVVSYLAPVVLQRMYSLSEVARVLMVMNVLLSMLRAVGVFFLVKAVFCDREYRPQESVPFAAQADHGPSGDNPFSTPRTQ